MARIAGINIPMNKHVWVGLTSIYGVGRSQAQRACEAAGVTIQRFHDVEGFEHDGRRVTAVVAHAERKYPHGAEAGRPHLSNYHTVLPEHGAATASIAATSAAPASSTTRPKTCATKTWCPTSRC